MNILFRKEFLGILLLFVIQGGIIWAMGHPAICDCGYIKVWENNIRSSEMSQHLSDWYTPSHIIHGMLFYGLLYLLFPGMSIWRRFLIAISIEAAWEIAENTPWVINEYRKQALAQGYVGDSTLNSLCDTLAMMFGFLLARKLPVWATVFLALSMEIFTGYFIHDNLFFNILNFIYPFDFIHEWQANV